MKSIGGYLELELKRESKSIHNKAKLALKSGRDCIKILIKNKSLRKIYIPYYACEAVIEPLKTLNVDYSFYELDENLEIKENNIEIDKNHSLIYINYFGIKDTYIQKLEQIYRNNLWIDHTHAFFYQPTNCLSWHFNSARKFFGVPDGAYLYGPDNNNLPSVKTWEKNKKYRFEHLILRHQNKVQDGYKIFKQNEKMLGGKTYRMSELTEILLSQIDYNAVASKRRENYIHLHKALKNSNQFSSQVLDLQSSSVPFCYPYLPKNVINKHYFWDQNIFVPIFWSDTLKRSPFGFNWEKHLSFALLPLPIDHRYNSHEMDIIIRAINSYGK